MRAGPKAVVGLGRPVSLRPHAPPTGGGARVLRDDLNDNSILRDDLGDGSPLIDDLAA